MTKILVVLVLATIVLAFGPWFKVKTINCRLTNQNPCPQAIVNELGRSRGQFIFFIPLDLLEHRLSIIVPTMADIRVNTNLPDTLNAILYPSDPVYSLHLKDKPGQVLVSSTYLAVDLVSETDTPLVHLFVDYPYALNVGDQIIDPPILAALAIIDEMMYHQFPHTQTTLVSDQVMVVALSDNRQAIFSLTKDPSRQVTSLQLILSKATIKTNLPVIDLRFQKPVLKTKVD